MRSKLFSIQSNNDVCVVFFFIIIVVDFLHLVHELLTFLMESIDEVLRNSLDSFGVYPSFSDLRMDSEGEWIKNCGEKLI